MLVVSGMLVVPCMLIVPCMLVVPCMFDMARLACAQMLVVLGCGTVGRVVCWQMPGWRLVMAARMARF